MALQATFIDTSTTRLPQLQMRFHSSKMDFKYTMTKYLRKKSVMIRDLNTVGNVLTDEQQIQDILSVLPKSWT